MNRGALHCRDDRRRDRVRASDLLGLDYVEVSPDQLTLTVVFLGRAPEDLQLGNLVLQGGERITDVRVTGFTMQPAEDPELDDVMLVTVDRPGDFSCYRLCVRAVDDRGRTTDHPLAGFDPRYACVDVRFKAACPSELDCKAAPACPPPERDEPEINYLAKDYDSFRQLIYDRLAVVMPGWRERHVPDIGVTLVELLASAGDQLSYFQDAVATEAYLATARRRISVRRHARFVDYFMHEGCNARAWICVQPTADFSFLPADVAFVTSLEDDASLAGKSMIVWDDLRSVRTDAYQVFEPLVRKPGGRIETRVFHNEIEIYTWGDQLCCLPVGATHATLLDAWTAARPAPENPDQPNGTARSVRATRAPAPERRLGLKAGDVLIFEEVKGPRTGNPADADPAHRWAVRLTRVTPAEDALLRTDDGRPTPLVEIDWEPCDALPFAVCLSTRLPAPDCRIIDRITVVRGNVVLADHGGTIRPPEDLGTVEKTGAVGCCACEGSVIELTPLPGKFRPGLRQSPLTFRHAGDLDSPAAKTLEQDPRTALPAIHLDSIPALPDGSGALFAADALEDNSSLARSLKIRTSPPTQALYSRLSAETKASLEGWDGVAEVPPEVREALAAELGALLGRWTPRRDLLASDADDPHFVVEMDDDVRAHLRFGDGTCGLQPGAGTGFVATYRVGNGTAGNVGADRITKILFQRGPVDGVAVFVRNPLAARGGVDPEPVAEVKLFAPGAFRKTLQRAITAGDYAAVAGRHRQLQDATAELHWTGSWYEAHVAVDPRNQERADAVLLDHVEDQLRGFRRLGHDLTVSGAEYVPLQLSLNICVQPHFLRAHVEAALRATFSNRALPGGGRGFFHPDNLTFGEGLFLSRIVAAAQAVPGVREVEVTAFHRLYESAGDELSSGRLVLGPGEIARLDNDPNYPEHGSLTLQLRGGR